MGQIASEGALRAATAALCSAGGCEVILRMPGLAVSGNDGEQLGLGAPEFQDIPIGPAAWRKVGVDSSLLLDGGAVARLMGLQGVASAESLFQSAVGVLVSGRLYVITKSEALLMAGTPCAYRLTLQEPAWT